MTKKVLYLVLAPAAFLFFGCNRVPTDMFPKTVGSFQLQGAPSVNKYERHQKDYVADYVSSNNEKIRCDGFNASTEEEANTYVKEYGIRDESQPLLDKTGKQIGLKALGPWSQDGNVWSLRWHKRTKAYRCVTEMSEPEKTLKEFYENWQKQISE